MLNFEVLRAQHIYGCCANASHYSGELHHIAAAQSYRLTYSSFFAPILAVMPYTSKMLRIVSAMSRDVQGPEAGTTL
jgi:hypothetical protein